MFSSNSRGDKMYLSPEYVEVAGILAHLIFNKSPLRGIRDLTIGEASICNESAGPYNRSQVNNCLSR